MTLEGLRVIFPGAPANAFPIRLKPGVSAARELASLTPRLPPGTTSDPPNPGATPAALVPVKGLPVLMALLLADLLWIVLLALLILLEKVTPFGRQITLLAGVVLIAGGVWLLSTGMS